MSHVRIESTTPCFRSIAHIITHDPGNYFEDHFGCVAYDYDRGPLKFKNGEDYTHSPWLYQCCNNKIEGFDLEESRHALLKVLMLQSPDNFEAFAATMMCDKHMEEGHMPVSWTRSIWFNEMSCQNLNWSGFCNCCNVRKPQYRWDAGMSAKDRQIALSLTAHMAPITVPDPQPTKPIEQVGSDVMSEAQAEEDSAECKALEQSHAPSCWPSLPNLGIGLIPSFRLEFDVRDVAVPAVAVVASIMTVSLMTLRGYRGAMEQTLC
jgi:hypothetical protein